MLLWRLYRHELIVEFFKVLENKIITQIEMEVAENMWNLDIEINYNTFQMQIGVVSRDFPWFCLLLNIADLCRRDPL